MLLTAALPPHIVAGVLGQENAQTVIKVYCRYITNDSKVAADAMARVFRECRVPADSHF